MEQGPESQLASDVCSVGPSSRMDASDLDANSLGAGSGPGNPHEHALPFRGEPAESWCGCDLISLSDHVRLMTIPFGTPEPSDGLLNKSVSSTRLRAWLNTRLRQLAVGQRIQDARALRSEFLVE